MDNHPQKQLTDSHDHPQKQFTDSHDHPQKHFSVKYNHRYNFFFFFIMNQKILQNQINLYYDFFLGNCKHKGIQSNPAYVSAKQYSASFPLFVLSWTVLEPIHVLQKLHANSNCLTIAGLILRRLFYVFFHYSLK